MTTVINDMRATLRSLFSRPPAYDAPVEWMRLVKRTVARYARGNIAAQNERILMPDEQDRERDLARPIAEKWREQHNASKPENESTISKAPSR
jgi:hypothetical protein